MGVTPRGSMARHRSSTWLGRRVPCSASNTRKSQPRRATYSISDGSAVRTKQPKTASPSASLAFVVFFSIPANTSIEPQADDVLPPPGRPRADHRRGDRRVGQGLGEPRVMGLPGDDGLEERQGL